MRKLALTVATAAAIMSAGSLAPTSASALALGGTGIRTAIEAINPVDNVACWWNGWRWVCHHHYYRYRYWRYRRYYH